MRSSTRALLLSCVFVTGLGRAGNAEEERERRSGSSRILSPIVRTHYDGLSNDLLTGGLGAKDLAGPAAPPVSTPPTADELRTLAIFNNYRALVDVAQGGGYGLFWGPSIPVPATGKAGMIPGDETLAFALQPDGSRVTLMVQIPTSFDPAHACIVTAPSSGSRGVYGAIATAGEWGLKHGCAVAYTDKGSGTGFDDLAKQLVTALRGEVIPVSDSGPVSQFTAELSSAQRAALTNRFAFKHAHSQVNPERDWGQYVLQSIRFAFAELERKFPGKIHRRNTVVIASSVSNGGGASLRAAEQDEEGLIDAVVVGEPNVNPVYARFAIKQGSQPVFRRHSRPLIDYVTLQNVYVGCAVALPGATYPFNFYPSPARCAALRTAGLLQSDTLAALAAEAQHIINDFGILPEQNNLEGVMWTSYVPQSISVTYANAYGRFSAADSLCGYGFGAVDANGALIPLTPGAENVLFATSNGIPPTGGVSLINTGTNTEIRRSPPDQYLQGALCLRSLATGRDPATGQRLAGSAAVQAERIEEGVEQIRARGDLHGKPALIVTGRADDILPPNFTSRAYVGLNRLEEGRESRLRYIEVKNAQHLDTILSLPAVYGLKQAYLPLHRYYVQAMDLMLAHLRSGAALPPSQVVQTMPRGGTATTVPDITVANVPPIVANPGANAITFDDRVLTIPE